MRIALLGLMLVLTAVSPHAQRTLDLRIQGDQIPAKPPLVVGQPVSVTGNVIVTVNEIKVRADMASYKPGASWVDVNGGTVRIELPAVPTSYGFSKNP